jgi:hypothetical protein
MTGENIDPDHEWLSEINLDLIYWQKKGAPDSFGKYLFCLNELWRFTAASANVVRRKSPSLSIFRGMRLWRRR